jgi:hypothetical protein
MRQAETITIACTKGTQAEIFIPGKPAHPTFKPFLSKQIFSFFFIYFPRWSLGCMFLRLCND